MKTKFVMVAIAGLLPAFLVMGGGSSSPSAGAEPPDKAKLSYAVGTRIGLQILDVKSRVDATVAIQAIQDVLDGKPTMIDEGEISSVLNQPPPSPLLGQSADDKTKYSYAGGMRAALLFKRTGFDLDSAVVVQAIKDELQNKPQMQESETVSLFKQAAAYEHEKKNLANQADGETFLAKNAKESGVHVLPDGLQYQVMEPGTGPLATTNDLIFVKFRGTFVNGVEFEHHDHFLTRIYGGIQGWKDVLPRMNVGSKWRLFIPPNLAFGDGGLPSRGIGPGTAVIYDLELVSIAPPNGSYQISSGMGRGSDIDASSSDSEPAK